MSSGFLVLLLFSTRCFIIGAFIIVGIVFGFVQGMIAR